MQRHAVRRTAGIRRGARRHDGRSRSTACWHDAVAGARLRLFVVLSPVLARGLEPAGAAALARSEYGSCRRTVDQGRPDQHGAFARSAAALARSSIGRVHAERGPCPAGRPATAPRQVAGSPTRWSRGCRRVTWIARSRALGCRCIAGSSAIRGFIQEAVRAPHGAGRAAALRWAANFAAPGRFWCSIAGSPPLTDAAPRILFVPVSGPYGMGEYARSSAIARAVQRSVGRRRPSSSS